MRSQSLCNDAHQMLVACLSFDFEGRVLHCQIDRDMDSGVHSISLGLVVQIAPEKRKEVVHLSLEKL